MRSTPQYCQAVVNSTTINDIPWPGREEPARLSSMFSRIDQWFIQKNQERKDLMRLYKDIPLSLEQLYSDHDYIRRQHGHDL